MKVINLILFAAGFHSLLFGIYLVFHGLRRKRANLYLGIFLFQIGVDLVFSFFYAEHLFANNRMLFYLPFYVSTLPTISIFFYFFETIRSKVWENKSLRRLLLIPILELFLLIIILCQYVIYEEDIWLQNKFYWTKSLYISGFQVINMILGMVFSFRIYRLITSHQDYLKRNEFWSGTVSISVQWLKLFLLGYFIFHTLWTVLIAFDILKIGGQTFYGKLLPYVYIFAAGLTYWISFKSIHLPKIVLSPWHSHSSNTKKTVLEAIQEKTVAVMIVNSEKRILYANTALLKYLNYTAKELENFPVSKILDKEDDTNITNLVLVDQSETSQKTEFIIRGNQGVVYLCDVNAFISADGKGKPVSFIFYLGKFQPIHGPSQILSQHHHEIGAQLTRLLQEQKIYKDPSLSLESLSGMLGISSRLASTLIKTFYQKSFRDLINEYRVNEVKEMLKQPEYVKYSLLSIGLEAGFNSKSTFHSVFKKATGITPMKYYLKNK